MKKTILAMIAVACLVIISLSAFALSYMQAPESEGMKNKKTVVDTDTQFADLFESQTFNSDIQQASTSDVAWSTVKVDYSCKRQDGQTLSEHELIVWPTKTNQSSISTLPLPLPDGRIFLRSSAGTEDPIPYIPTWNPKITSRTPIEPLELDI